MDSEVQTHLLYYDKVLFQKFHSLYAIFSLFYMGAIAIYIRRYCKGAEKVIILPVAYFFLRLIDLLYHFGSDYQEVEIVTSNMALIPFSILMAKYTSFLPKYNDFPLSNDNKKNSFGVKEAKQYINTIKQQYRSSLTPLLVFMSCLLIIMGFGITSLFMTNLLFFAACVGCFAVLLMTTLEVRLAKESRTKANIIVSNIFLLAVHFALKLVLPWRVYSDTLYSLFFSLQYLLELSTVVLMTDIMTNLMLIKYIVYV